MIIGITPPKQIVRTIAQRLALSKINQLTGDIELIRKNRQNIYLEYCGQH